MSIKAMNWAWAQKMAPTPKLILMALADSANDFGECWPGVPFVAKKCCVSERTVQRVFQGFEAAGLVTIDRDRYTNAGRRTSNFYRLDFENIANPDNLSPHKQSLGVKGDKLSPMIVTPNVTVEGDTTVSPLEPPQKSIQQPPHYPRQLSDAERQAIATLLATVGPADAQALLDELSDALESKTIKTSAVRWFRALVTRQISGTFTPTAGIRIAERRNRQLQKLQKEQTDPRPETTDRTAAHHAIALAKKELSKARKIRLANHEVQQ